MAMIAVNGSMVATLNNIVARWNINGVILHLFQNNYTPVHGSALGNFTEATFSGYATRAPGFLGGTQVGDFAVAADGAARTFTVAAGGVTNTIYGYYVTDPSTGLVVLAERFSAPISMNVTGDEISITLQVSLSSLN